MEEQVCPRCQQGRVSPFTVRGTSDHVLVCDECEAVWPASGDPTSTEFESLASFMADREGESLWDDLEPADPPERDV